MKRRVIVRPEAKADIREARKWYRNISPALAAGFVEAVSEAIEGVRERPEMYPGSNFPWNLAPPNPVPPSDQSQHP